MLKRIEMSRRIEKLSKLRETVSSLIETLKELSAKWNEYLDQSKKLPKSDLSESDTEKITLLKKKFVENLKLYHYSSLSAFWLEENSAIYWIYSKIIIVFGVFLPVELLPVWLQKISLLLPFSYITYGPAKLVVDYSTGNALRIIEMQAAYLALFIIAAFFIFREGVKKINVNGG